MNLLLVDTETTGLDPEKGCRAIEVGAILYSVPFRTPLQSVAFLLPTDENPAAHINGIDPAITNLDQPWRTALALFREMAANADYALAHNADFDRQFFGHGPLEPLHLQWICSMTDLEWGDIPGRSLRDLALAHGIAVMPEVHRALPDCELISQVLSKRDDLEELIAQALVPKLIYRALVSFNNREEAKSRGFRWNPDRKQWLKKLTTDQASKLEADGLMVQAVAA
jgi:DNA polymerase III subunit epsilon